MLDCHRAGDIDGLLSAYARDVRFVFPGRSYPVAHEGAQA
jgi:hypothetical protein